MVVGDSKEGKVDLVGLVPAKEPRPLRKTFGLPFTPLNVRSRGGMNGHKLTRSMNVSQTLFIISLCVSSFV